MVFETNSKIEKKVENNITKNDLSYLINNSYVVFDNNIESKEDFKNFKNEMWKSILFVKKAKRH